MNNPGIGSSQFSITNGNSILTLPRVNTFWCPNASVFPARTNFRMRFRSSQFSTTNGRIGCDSIPTLPRVNTFWCSNTGQDEIASVFRLPAHRNFRMRYRSSQFPMTNGRIVCDSILTLPRVNTFRCSNTDQDEIGMNNPEMNNPEMNNREIGISHFSMTNDGSSHFSMTNDGSSQFSTTNGRIVCGSILTLPCVNAFWPNMNQDEIAKIHREDRKCKASLFRREYTYGISMDHKTCISSYDSFPWPDKSSGITWVGVHGMDSICVVTRTGDLDVTRVHDDIKHLSKETVLSWFRRTVISEIEDLADPSSKLRQRLGQCIEKPFGVVSVILTTNMVHKESGHEFGHDALNSLSLLYENDYESDEYEQNKIMNSASDEYKEKIRKYFMERQPPADYDETKSIKFLQEKMKRETTLTTNETEQASSAEYEKKAIKFLQEKMSSDTTFTIDETIQTAISALQSLFQKKFKANEIEVSVWEPNYYVSAWEAKHKDLHVKELEICEIEGHLTVINKDSGSGSSTITTEGIL